MSLKAQSRLKFIAQVVKSSTALLRTGLWKNRSSVDSNVRVFGTQD